MFHFQTEYSVCVFMLLFIKISSNKFCNLKDKQLQWLFSNWKRKIWQLQINWESFWAAHELRRMCTFISVQLCWRKSLNLWCVVSYLATDNSMHRIDPCRIDHRCSQPQTQYEYDCFEWCACVSYWFLLCSINTSFVHIFDALRLVCIFSLCWHKTFSIHVQLMKPFSVETWQLKTLSFRLMCWEFIVSFFSLLLCFTLNLILFECVSFLWQMQPSTLN